MGELKGNEIYCHVGSNECELRVANLKKKSSATLSHVHDDFKEKKKKKVPVG